MEEEKKVTEPTLVTQEPTIVTQSTLVTQEQQPITKPEKNKELIKEIDEEYNKFESLPSDTEVKKAITKTLKELTTEKEEGKFKEAPQIKSVDTTLPNTSLPNTSLPNTTLPNTSLPNTSLPNTSLPNTSLPNTTLQDTTLPQQGGIKPCNQFSVCLDDVYIYPKIKGINIYFDITMKIILCKKRIGTAIIDKKYQKFNGTPLDTLEKKVQKMNELNNLYKPEQLTIVENTETQSDYNELFGNNKNCNNIFYKLPLPFCLTINQVIQLFQEMYLTQFTVFEKMIDDYNKFRYQIIGDKKNIYIELFNKKIPIKKSTFYEIDLPDDFIINDIHIDESKKTYGFKLNILTQIQDREIQLKNINKQDLDANQKITKLNTMYKLGDNEVIIDNYYYYIDVLCSVGTQITDMNQLHLLEDFEKDENIKNIENFILIEYIFPESVVNILWDLYQRRYTLINSTNLDEMKIYYESKSETTNDILVLIKRKINPRRFFSLLLYISRIYNEKFPTHWLGSLYSEIDRLLGGVDFYKNPDYINEFIRSTYTIFEFMFNNYTIFFCSNVLYNNIINGKYISSISTKGLFGGGIDELIKPITDFFINSTTRLEDFSKELVTNVDNYSEFVLGESNTTIDKKILKWVTNVDGAEPDIIEFISNYINQPSIKDDLLNKKSRENICNEISELQNSMDSIFSDLKLLLPNNYFNSELYMEKYLENAEKK